jgi:hypothetical protein
MKFQIKIPLQFVTGFFLFCRLTLNYNNSLRVRKNSPIFYFLSTFNRISEIIHFLLLQTKHIPTMHYRCLFILPVVFLFSCGSNDKPVDTKTIHSTFTNCFCSDTSQNHDLLCPDIPHEVLLTFNTIGYDSHMSPTTQPPFDLFSWQSFVALNWPADASGNPEKVPFGSDNTSLRVWEHYTLADTVFEQAGSNGAAAKLKLVLKPGDARAKKQLYQTSKFSENINVNNHFFEADSSTLIDKNLNYVLYEERINGDEWNFINDSNLRTEQGQLNYVATHDNGIILPAGSYTQGQWGKPDAGPIGAIEIKASWRILDPTKGDDTTHYYHQQALITIDGQYTWSGRPLVFTATVGLVGFHIIHKTGIFAKEIWSTFEQIDNAPDSGQTGSTTNYSFYNGTYQGAPYQKPPVINGKKAMWNDTPPYALSYAVNVSGDTTGNRQFGSQSPRYYSIYSTTDSLNKLWQAKLAGTVWAYYKLVGTQWFSSESTNPDNVPNAPVYLANTTLETYIQPTASCISCHSFATVAGTPQDSASSPRYKSDFSFLFGHAASPTEFFRLPSQTSVPKKK